MTKLVSNNVIDAALDYVAGNGSARDVVVTMYVCSGDPADRTAAITNALATHALVDGDFTIADDTSGRKSDIAEQADINVDVNGTAAHICICDSTELLLKTSCSSTVLSDTGTVTVQTFKQNIQDPT